MAGDTNYRDENTVKRLLVLDTMRGQDSTGLAAVRKSGKEVTVAKMSSHPFILFEMKRFTDALSYGQCKAFIGHNRSATSGDARKETNAHPFQYGHITGVHNGTLADGDKEILERKLGEKFDVDSQALFAAFAKFGAKEVIPLLTRGKDYVRGAWSLVWWDTEANTLNFLRNEHRPMWYCYTEDCKQLWWASEFWMLDAALNHTQIGSYKFFLHPSKDNPEKKFKFRQTPTDMWLSIDVDKLAKGGKEPPKFTAIPLAGKEPKAKEPYDPFPHSHQHGSSCGQSSGGNVMRERLEALRAAAKTKSGQTTKSTTSSTKDRRSVEPGVVHLIGDTESPYANYISDFEFARVGHDHRNGEPVCNWCRRTVPYGMAGITVFFRDNVLLCTRCSGHDEVSILSDIAPPSRFLITKAMMTEIR
jgi:hypothetical protein